MKYIVYKHGWDHTDPDASIPFDIDYGTYDTYNEARKEYEEQVILQDEHLDKTNETPVTRTEEKTFTQWIFPKALIEVGIHPTE